MDKLVYSTLNPSVLKNVPRDAKHILDVGCGSGQMGEAIKAQQPCHVTGLTYSEEEAQQARSRIDEVFVCNLNEPLPGQLGQYDLIICSHVLEHLYDPGTVVRNLSRHLTTDGRLLVALPNVLNWKQRMQFVRGRFRYSPNGGVMDQTHYRFFDVHTARSLLLDSGLQVVHFEAQGNFPLPGLRRIVPGLAGMVDRAGLSVSPGLFAYQFVMVATPSQAA